MTWLQRKVSVKFLRVGLNLSRALNRAKKLESQTNATFWFSGPQNVICKVFPRFDQCQQWIPVVHVTGSRPISTIYFVRNDFVLYFCELIFSTGTFIEEIQEKAHFYKTNIRKYIDVSYFVTGMGIVSWKLYLSIVAWLLSLQQCNYHHFAEIKPANEN